MSEHIKIDTADATPATEIDAAMEAIQREINVRDNRIEQLEKRLDDQEYSVRRVLDMLIDWLESDEVAATEEKSDSA